MIAVWSSAMSLPYLPLFSSSSIACDPHEAMASGKIETLTQEGSAFSLTTPIFNSPFIVMAAAESKTIHPLTASQKRDLLRFVRDTIAAHLAGSSPPPAEPLRLNEVFAGVFVSLHVDQRLRGCIGYVEGLRPLPDVVQETAIAAALRDPRFEPLEAEELDRVEIEISVLSPLRKIETLSEIQLGRHGLMVRYDKQQGLLLPQVALHNNWDTETFLAQVCLKAGLSSDAWKEQNTEIYIFEAEVFSDTPTTNQAE